MSDPVRIESNTVLAREDLEEAFPELKQKARANKDEHEYYVKIPARFGADDQHLHGRVRNDGEAVNLTLQFVHKGFGRYLVNIRPPKQVNDVEVITTRELDLNDMGNIGADEFAARVLEELTDTYSTQRYTVVIQ